MSKFKIPGVSFSLNRALGITQAKQKFARETGIPTSKAGLERKIGKMVLSAIFVHIPEHTRSISDGEFSRRIG